MSRQDGRRLRRLTGRAPIGASGRAGRAGPGREGRRAFCAQSQRHASRGLWKDENRSASGRPLSCPRILGSLRQRDGVCESPGRGGGPATPGRPPIPRRHRHARWGRACRGQLRRGGRHRSRGTGTCASSARRSLTLSTSGSGDGTGASTGSQGRTGGRRLVPGPVRKRDSSACESWRSMESSTRTLSRRPSSSRTPERCRRCRGTALGSRFRRRTVAQSSGWPVRPW